MRPRPEPRARAASALAALALVASLPHTASALVALAPQPSTLGASVTRPVWLAAGENGATTLGANATRAWTTVEVRVQSPASPSLLRVSSASAAPQSAFLRLAGSANLSRVQAATISLGGAAQIVIVAGVVTQSSGSPVALPPGGTAVAGAVVQKASAASVATLHVEVVAAPAGAPGARLVERWTIALV